MGAAAGGALLAIAKPAADLEEQIKNTLTLTGETGDAFARMEEGMTKKAIELSTKLGISADQVAQGFYQVLSTGAQALTPEFDALSETGLKMAKTVGLAPADAVEVLSDTVNAFQLEMTEAGRVADVFFTASKLSTLTVPQLVDSMREAAPAASAMGLSLEETATVLAGFASKGVKGAKAGTAFRILLTRLAKPPVKTARALRFPGGSVFDATGNMRPMIDVLKDMQRGMKGLTGAQKAAVLKALAGEEAFSKLGGLMDSNLDTLGSWQEEMKKGGALQLAFSQKMGAASEQVRLLWISVQDLAISLGQPLLGPISAVAGWLSKMVQRMAAFAQAHPLLGKVAGAVLALVAVVSLLVGGLLTATGVLGLFVLKWLPLAKAGMSAFSGAITGTLSTLLGWGRALLLSAQAGRIHALATMDVGAALKAAGLAAWSNVKAFWAWTSATVRDIAAKIAHGVAVAASTLATWAASAASTAAAAAQWLWNIAMTANPIGLIIVGVAALIAGVVMLVKNWDAVTGAVQTAFSWLKDLLGKTPDWLLALIFPIGLLIKHFDKVKEVAVAVFGSVADAVQTAFGVVKDVIGAVFDWVADKVAWVSGKVDAFIAGVKGVGEFLGISSAGPTPAMAGGPGAVAASASSPARAVASPRAPMGPEAALPVFAGTAPAGNLDQSVNISSGAIQVHAMKVDDEAVRQIDMELAKRIRRRQERQ